MTTATTEKLAIASIHPNPGQPRQFFDADALTELAQSIAQHGLLQPIVVRPDGDGYVIVAGERRYRACRQVGMTQIEARVLDIDAAEAFVLSTIENVNRQDMTPSEEARAYAQIMAAGRTVDETAQLVGKTPDAVRMRIALLNLRDDLLTLLDHKQLPPDLANLLTRLDHNGQAEVVRKFQHGDFAEPLDASRYASAVYARQQQPGLFGAPSAFDAVREEHRRRERVKFEEKMERLARMTSLFVEILEQDEVQLADVLGETTAQQAAIAKEVARQAGRVATRLANAAAVQHVKVSCPHDTIKVGKEG